MHLYLDLVPQPVGPKLCQNRLNGSLTEALFPVIVGDKKSGERIGIPVLGAVANHRQPDRLIAAVYAVRGAVAAVDIRLGKDVFRAADEPNAFSFQADYLLKIIRADLF